MAPTESIDIQWIQTGSSTWKLWICLENTSKSKSQRVIM